MPKRHKRPYEARAIANSRKWSQMSTSYLTIATVQNIYLDIVKQLTKGEVRIFFGQLKILEKFLIN